MGRKKILIGSIFVLTLILLMPSIPAIQQKTIEDSTYSHFAKNKIDFNINKIEKLEQLKHPILFLIILTITIYNILRVSFYSILFSYSIDNSNPDDITIKHPLLAIISAFRGLTIYIPVLIWIYFWNYISNQLGWNWNFQPQIIK